jgi:hypothetical protein
MLEAMAPGRIDLDLDLGLGRAPGTDELLITAHAHSPDLRLRSYELTADAYALPRT